MKSLKEPTFQESRKFLGRYRYLRVLRDILDYDQKSRRAKEPILQADRTPAWFARLYIRQTKKLNGNAEPSVHLSSDSGDSEDGSDFEHLIEPYQIRSLRHRHKPDVLRLFRKHADWLINDQKNRYHKQKRLFDPAVWKHWLVHGEGDDNMDTDDDSDNNGDDDMDVDDEEGQPQLSAVARGKRKAVDVGALSNQLLWETLSSFIFSSVQ